MKTRNGFVSNSSTSSFCIYGTHFGEEDFIVLLKKIKKTDNDAYIQGINKILNDEKFDWTREHYSEEIELLKKIDKLTEQEEDRMDEFLRDYYFCELLTAWLGDDYELFDPYDGDYGIYIGRSWAKIKDKETGGEFKASIEKDLKSVLGANTKCETLEEAWRDG